MMPELFKKRGGLFLFQMSFLQCAPIRLRAFSVMLVGAMCWLSMCDHCMAQFGGALGRIGRNISNAGKKAGGDIAREGKKLGGDISREGKQAGGDIAREGKQAINDVGALVEKPFRHAGENVKESLFLQMRNHVIGKNNELGKKGISFGPGHGYYKYIQPHLPNGMDFRQVVFYFDAYVPGEMAGITFDNTVYIRGPYQEFDPNQLGLLAHETGHVIQYRNWGWKGFARKYCDDALGGWMKYPDFNVVKIHDSIEIEREADQFAARVLAAFERSLENNRPNPNQFQPPNLPPGFPNPGDLIQPNGTPTNPLGGQNPFQGQIPNVGQPRLGVNLQPVPGRGAMVTFVWPGMPAERAGIEVDDIIVSIDGQRVMNSNDVLAILRRIAGTGRNTAKVQVENSRLRDLPIDQRMVFVDVNW